MTRRTCTTSCPRVIHHQLIAVPKPLQFTRGWLTLHLGSSNFPGRATPLPWPLPIAGTASSADVQLSLSSDPNPTAFAALQIDPKPYFTPFKSRLSSYDGDHQPHVRSAINCRLMGGLITKEIPAHMIVEDQLLCQKIFPIPVFLPISV
jgi:hypothetical protein